MFFSFLKLHIFPLFLLALAFYIMLNNHMLCIRHANNMYQINQMSNQAFLEQWTCWLALFTLEFPMFFSVVGLSQNNLKQMYVICAEFKKTISNF